MHRFGSLRFPSPELAFGLLSMAVWILLVLEVYGGVMAPLARSGMIS
jgi:hypothetical protein